MTENYPKIGSIVDFTRTDEKGAIHSGKGTVQAIFVDVDGRLKCRVREGQNAWNVEASLINASPDHVAAYSAALVEVQRLTDEGNKLVRETVDSYNARVDEAYAAVLGPKIEIEYAETPEEGAV